MICTTLRRLHDLVAEGIKSIRGGTRGPVRARITNEDPNLGAFRATIGTRKGSLPAPLACGVKHTGNRCTRGREKRPARRRATEPGAGLGAGYQSSLRTKIRRSRGTDSRPRPYQKRVTGISPAEGQELRGISPITYYARFLPRLRQALRWDSRRRNNRAWRVAGICRSAQVPRHGRGGR